MPISIGQDTTALTFDPCGERSHAPTVGLATTPMRRRLHPRSTENPHKETHMAKKTLGALALLTVTGIALAGCAGGGGSSDADNTIDGDVKGDITVVTWRTDLIADGTFDKYAEEFTAKYPDVKVTFEGITDYAGEMQTRMSTSNYGDVLGIPTDLPQPVRAVPRAPGRDRGLRGHLPVPPRGELRRHAVRHRLRRQRERRHLQQEGLGRGRDHRRRRPPKRSGSTRCRRSRTTPTRSRSTRTTRTAGRSPRASATSASSPTTRTRRSRWRRTRPRGPRAPMSTPSTRCCTNRSRPA